MNRENSIQDTRPYPLPCPATRVNAAGVTEHCTRERGHDGEHHDGPLPGWTGAPGALGAMCPAVHPRTGTGCARFDGHPLPHRDKDGSTWGEPEETLADRLAAAEESIAALREDLGRILETVEDGLAELLEGLAALRNRGARREQAAAAADDGLEPYCRTCTGPIGHFLGHEGWWHWRGEGTPESKTELYDAGHPIVVAWREASAQ